MTRKRRIVMWIVIAAAAVVIAFLAGALPRLRTRNAVRRDTDELAVPYVSVVQPKRAPLANEVVLPGSVQAFAEAPIFARGSGYVQRWYADIGAHVKSGQLLAVLFAPEIEQQLQQARGVLATSEANLRLAETNEKRFAAAVQTHAVSQLEYDTAVGTRAADQATVDANEANVKQLEQQLAYLRVVAPFDGVITVRNIDIGDLVSAGNSSTTGPELFHLVQADVLRVFVTVPEPYAQLMLPGLLAELVLPANPGAKFRGVLVRTARAIDPTTRTLRVEIQVDNRAGRLLAGAFSQVHIKVPGIHDIYIIPVESLLFRSDGLQVASVEAGRIKLKPIVPGHDFGDRIEVTAGLTAADLVVLDPPDSITEGQRVRVATPR